MSSADSAAGAAAAGTGEAASFPLFDLRSAHSADGTRVVALYLPCRLHSTPSPSSSASESASPRPRPLLLVHGALTVADEWLPVANLLALHRPVAILERRARGRSGDKECTQAHSLSVEAADVAALVQELGGEVDLFGHSFGGAVVAQYAMDTQHAGALLLFDPGSGMRGPITTSERNEQVMKRLRDGQADEALELCLTSVNGLPAQALPQLRAIQPLWSQMKQLLVSNLREVLSLTSFSPSSAALSRIRGRTHLLLSDLAGDGLRHMAGEWVARHVGVSLTPLRGVGHTAYLDKPEMVATAIQQVLQGDQHEADVRTRQPASMAGGATASSSSSSSVAVAVSSSPSCPPVDVGSEPFHKPILLNSFVRVLDVRIPASARSLFHTHSEQSVYVYLTPSVLTSQAWGAEEVVQSSCVPGLTRFEAHDRQAYTHRVANLSDDVCRTYDIELLPQQKVDVPTHFDELPAQAQLLWQQARGRVSRLVLGAGESCALSRASRPVLLIGLSGELRVRVDATLSHHYRWADLRFYEAGSMLEFSNSTHQPAEVRILQMV